MFQVSIPCKKRCFRLYGKEGYPLVDIMIRESEPSPKVTMHLCYLLVDIWALYLAQGSQVSHYRILEHILEWDIS